MARFSKQKIKEPNLFTAAASSNSITDLISTPYQGASFKRSLKKWDSAVFSTADEALLPNLQTLRSRSYDAIRNQPAARGAIRTMRKGVIGWSLRMQASIDREFLKMSEEQAQLWQAKTQQEFRMWSESRNCDFLRQFNFAGLQKLAFTSQRTAGDCFVLLPFKPYPNSPYDLRVQIIDADRICNPNDLSDTAEIAGGIERNEEGIPIAIYIRTPHPAATLIQQITPTWQRIPLYGKKTGRRNVLHLMSVDRIGQTRGEPILAPVIETLRQISSYTQAELSAAVMNAMLTIGVERPLEDTTTSLTPEYKEGEEPWNRSDNYQLGNGTWVDFAPGEKANIISAVRPSSQFDPFFLANIKQIGMALGIPYEVLIKHFSSSYSASRAAMLDFHRDCVDEREEFIEAFCQPIYEEFLMEAVDKGRVKAPGYMVDPYKRLAYSGAYWIGPSQGQIDEVKEVEAAHKRVMYGFSDMETETQKLSGKSYRDIVRTQIEEMKLCTDAGLPHFATDSAKNDFQSEDKENGTQTSGQGDSGNSENSVGNNS
jgi:lambda family phage portal protein